MKMRLQSSIASLLVGLMLTVIAALGASSYYFSRNSAGALRDRILSDTATDVYGEIMRLLENARNQSCYDRNRLREGALKPTDFASLARSWSRPLETHPEIAFFSFTTPDGDTLRLARSPGGKPYLQERRASSSTANPELRVFVPGDYPDGPHLFLSEGNTLEDQLRIVRNTAARLRPGMAAWTEVHDFPGSHGGRTVPGTAYVMPVTGTDGARLGVLATGVDMAALRDHLRKLTVGEQGFVFVAQLDGNRPGAVIAHSSSEVVWKSDLDKDPAHTSRPAGSEDEARVGAFLAKLPSIIETGFHARFKPIAFEFDGQAYTGGYEYLKDLPEEQTPEWIICTVLPEREIMGRVWDNHRLLLSLGLGIVGLGLLASLFLARRVARALKLVVAETRAIGRLDCEPRSVVQSRVVEISDLGAAVEEMKTSLRSFQKYVPADLVRILLQSKREACLGGEARVCTILFADIADFTTVGEELGPSELVEHLGEYLGALSAEIARAGGTVDKYIGDAIMAFWGAPLPNTQHALAACTAALECQAALRRLRPKWQKQGRPAFTARIGINTGEVVVGNIGSETRLNYTVIGDAVNVASRLEGINKQFGTEIILSERTYQEAGPSIEAKPLDWVQVKGKKQAFLAYELIGLRK